MIALKGGFSYNHCFMLTHQPEPQDFRGSFFWRSLNLKVDARLKNKKAGYPLLPTKCEWGSKAKC